MAPSEGGNGARRSPILAKLLLWLYAALIVGMVFLFEWSLVKPGGSFNVSYYDELADAFLAGQTHLLRDPPPELLALPDPWNAQLNKRFRMVEEVPDTRYRGLHDLTLYQGKLYLAWGPLPALLLIPPRWLAGHDLPMGHLVLIVETMAALAYAAATLILARIAGLRRSRPIDLLVVLTFLLCPFWTYTLRRIAVYETAIFFAQLFEALALFCVVVAIDRRQRRGARSIGLLGLGSLCLGCAVNCRPDVIPLGLMVPVLLWVWWRSAPLLRWRRLVVAALALGLPALLLLGADFAYNLVRFGDPLEVGLTWQLSAGEGSLWQHNFHFIAVERLLPNVWYYLLAPVTNSSIFPILLAPTRLQPHDWMAPATLAIYGDDVGRTGGLFVVVPITILTLLWPLLLMRGAGHRRAGRIVGLVVLAAGLSGALPFLAPAILRYAAEWCMWWLMAGLLMALQLRTVLAGRRCAAILFDVTLLLSTAWTCWAGISFFLFRN